MSKEKKIAAIVEQSLLLAKTIAEQSADNPKMVQNILGRAVTMSAQDIQQQVTQLSTHEN